MADQAETQHILTSWKEIAHYFGKGVRTVQRWEREMKLPVRRPDGQDNKVLAHRKDLDNWLESKWSRRLPSDNKRSETHLPLDLLRERCELVREKQRLLREQLQKNVMALYTQCDTLKRSCDLALAEALCNSADVKLAPETQKETQDPLRTA